MNIIITGTSRGIGFELVNHFVKGGHRVVAISRNTERLRETYIDNTNVLVVSHDLSSLEYNDLSIDIRAFFGESVDILIHNAGQLINKPFSELNVNDVERSYRTNVYAPIFLTQALGSSLSDHAHVITIGSMGGFQGSLKFPGLLAYSSAKAALVCVTECLQEEFKETNRAFNCLCLGAVQTEMLNEAFPGYEAPLSSEEMASYIMNFALHSGKFLKGKVIPVSVSNP